MTGVGRVQDEGAEGKVMGVKTTTSHNLTFLTSPLKDCYLNKWHTGIHALGRVRSAIKCSVVIPLMSN